MSDDDKRAIERFADGHPASAHAALRAVAIEAYRRHLRDSPGKHNEHTAFMSEVDNPSPDLALRARYRGELMQAVRP